MGTALPLLMYWCHVTGQRMVRWRLQQKGSWGSVNEGQQGEQNSSVSCCNILLVMGESFQQQSAFISSQANYRWTDSEKFIERIWACFLLTLKSQMWVRHLQGVHLHHLLYKKCSVFLHSLNPYFYFCLSVLLYLLLALPKAFKTPLLHNVFTSHSLFPCCSDFPAFPCRRTAPSSSDTAQPRVPGSRTPSPCSTSRRSTTFPFVSWRRREATPSEKRARRTRRWGSSRKEKTKRGGFWEKCRVFNLITSLHLSFPLRFSAPSTRWSPTTRITSSFW